MNRKRIDVTATDIKKGLARNGCMCPVARAAKRAFRTGESVFVMGYIWALDVTWDMPKKALWWIVRYDSGKPVRPFSFYATRHR